MVSATFQGVPIQNLKVPTLVMMGIMGDVDRPLFGLMLVKVHLWLNSAGQALADHIAPTKRD